MSMEDDVARLSDALISEIRKAFGLPPGETSLRLVRAVCARATRRLADIGLTFDTLIRTKGLPAAAQWSVTNWCRDIIARGQERIPSKGPLLVISNHPGAYDALVLSAQVPRPDLHIIASDLPFIRSLPNFSRRIFFIPINKQEVSQRMSGMLSAVRYIKQGGAVLLMGSGTIDPDPAVYPGALEHLQRWTEAVNLFARFVPRVQVVLAVVSHIVSPQWARHPLTWLQGGGLGKRRIAEFGQVLHQLFHPGRLFVSPRISFSSAIQLDGLGTAPREWLLQQETQLMLDHCSVFGGEVP